MIKFGKKSIVLEKILVLSYIIENDILFSWGYLSLLFNTIARLEILNNYHLFY